MNLKVQIILFFALVCFFPATAEPLEGEWIGFSIYEETPMNGDAWERRIIQLEVWTFKEGKMAIGRYDVDEGVRWGYKGTYSEPSSGLILMESNSRKNRYRYQMREGHLEVMDKQRGIKVFLFKGSEKDFTFIDRISEPYLADRCFSLSSDIAHSTTILLDFTKWGESHSYSEKLHVLAPKSFTIDGRLFLLPNSHLFPLEVMRKTEGGFIAKHYADTPTDLVFTEQERRLSSELLTGNWLIIYKDSLDSSVFNPYSISIGYEAAAFNNLTIGSKEGSCILFGYFGYLRFSSAPWSPSFFSDELEGGRWGTWTRQGATYSSSSLFKISDILDDRLVFKQEYPSQGSPPAYLVLKRVK